MNFINTNDGDVFIRSIRIIPERIVDYTRYYYPDGIEKWVIDNKFPFIHRERFYCYSFPNYYRTVQDLFKSCDGIYEGSYIKNNKVYRCPEVLIFDSEGKEIGYYRFREVEELMEYLRKLSQHIDLRSFVNISSKDVLNLSVLSYQEEELKSLIYEG